MFQAVVAVGSVGIFWTLMVELGDAMSQRFQLPLHRMQFLENSHAFGENGAARERETILRQVPSRRSLGDNERAIIERIQPGENLHQRGFAGAVRAHQADAVARRDQPVGIFKKKFVAETFSGPRKLNHGLDSSSHKMAWRIETN